jgi:mono/diheme cytochrome c family protein
MNGVAIMKLLRTIALLTAVTGTIVYETGRMPILAASDTPASEATIAAGAKVFQANCIMCHGAKMDGHPPMFPSLAGKGRQLNTQQLTDLIHKDKGNMPGFATRLSEDDIAALLAYLANDPTFTPPAATPPASSSQPSDAPH